VPAAVGHQRRAAAVSQRATAVRRVNERRGGSGWCWIWACGLVQVIPVYADGAGMTVWWPYVTDHPHKY
jgi:hypothetical protein